MGHQRRHSSKQSPLERFETYFLENNGIVSQEDFIKFIEDEKISLTSGLKSRVIEKGEHIIFQPLLEAEKEIYQALQTLKSSDQSSANLGEIIDEFVDGYQPPAQKSQPSKEIDDARFEVLRNLLDYDSRVVVLRGAPGSTKSTLARYAIAILRKSLPATDKQDFWILSHSHKAMAKFRDRAKIYGATLSSALAEGRDNIIIPEGAVVAVDEAGLLGTETMLSLLKKAVDQGWRKLILLGDCRQETPKQAGQPLALIETYFPELCFELTHSFRQKNEDARDLVKYFYCGDGKSAIELLDSLDSLEFSSGREAVIKELTRRYCAIAKEHGTNSVLVAVTDSSLCNWLNASIRESLINHRLLEPIGSDKDDNYFLVGERVVLLRSAKGKTERRSYDKTVRAGRMANIHKISKKSVTLAFDRAPDPELITFPNAVFSKIARAYALPVRDIQGLAADHIIFGVVDEIQGQTIVSAGSRHRHSLSIVVDKTLYNRPDFLKAISKFEIKPILISYFDKILKSKGIDAIGS